MESGQGSKPIAQCKHYLLRPHAAAMHTTRSTPDKEAIALLPEFPRLGLGQITLVNTAEQAREACARLREQASLGFDTESKPTFFKDQVSEGPHIVQLSTLNHAWVFQLHEADCRDQVAQLLAEPQRALAGFGLGDDNKRILAKLGVVPVGSLDLNHLFRERGYRKDMGVKGAVAVLFNQRFLKSKKAATSNWANLQLSEGQLVYAANDAYAAACVFEALKKSVVP
jgi:ribonuclease D